MGGNIILFELKFQRYNHIFQISLQFLSELNNIFHIKGLKDLLMIGERPNKKNIESLNLRRKVNIFRL